MVIHLHLVYSVIEFLVILSSFTSNEVLETHIYHVVKKHYIYVFLCAYEYE